MLVGQARHTVLLLLGLDLFLFPPCSKGDGRLGDLQVVTGLALATTGLLISKIQGVQQKIVQNICQLQYFVSSNFSELIFLLLIFFGLISKEISTFSAHVKTSLLRRLQGRPFPAEAPPIGKIHPFSKMAVTFEPLMGF